MTLTTREDHVATKLEPREADARLTWVDGDSFQERDAFGGNFETRGSKAWQGVSVLEGRVRPHERSEGHFPMHVLSVNCGRAVPFEANLPGRSWYSSTVGPGHVNVWPAGMRHAARWLQYGDWIVVQIDRAFVATVTTSLGLCGPADLRPSVGVPDPVAAHLATALALESRMDGAGNRLVVESLGTALVGHLVYVHAGAASGYGPAPAARGATLGPARLRRVVGYIEAHLGSDLSLAGLAKVVDMDVFRFVRAFKTATGHPPHHYVLLARVDRAKELLHDPKLSISEIALRTGFATPSHFATTFHRISGTTPRAWRNTVV